MSMEHWWMFINEVKSEILEKTSPFTLSSPQVYVDYPGIKPRSTWWEPVDCLGVPWSLFVIVTCHKAASRNGREIHQIIQTSRVLTTLHNLCCSQTPASENPPIPSDPLPVFCACGYAHTWVVIYCHAFCVNWRRLSCITYWTDMVSGFNVDVSPPRIKLNLFFTHSGSFFYFIYQVSS